MNRKLYNAMNWREIEGILYGDSAHPETVLGAHAHGRKIIVQAYAPGADKVELISGEETVSMEEMDNSFYAAFLEKKDPDYRLRISLPGGEDLELRDPYSFALQLPEAFLKDFTDGVCTEAHHYLGAHSHTVKLAGKKEVKGVLFAVWAPGADAVQLCLPRFSLLMKRHDAYGVFELFIPMELEGEQYHFQIRKGAKLMGRIDPYATRFAGGFPVVCAEIPKCKPLTGADKSELIIRRVDLRRHEDTKELVHETKTLGFTHISVYFSTTGTLFSPEPERGSLEDYLKLTEECHKEGLGIIYDWRIDGFDASRSHFSKFDGTALYEHEDPRRGYRAYDDRFLYQYQCPQVRNYLLSAAFFLAEELGADGILAPALGSVLYLDYHKSSGEWLPNFMGENIDRDAISLIQSFNLLMEKAHPGLLRLSSVGAIWKECVGKPEGECLGFERAANEDYARDFPEFLFGNESDRRGAYSRAVSAMQYAFVEPRFLMIPIASGQLQRFGTALSMLTPGKKLFEMDNIEDRGFFKELMAFYRQEHFLSENDDREESLQFINHVCANDLTLSYIRKGTKKKDRLFVVVNSAFAGRKFPVGVEDPGHYELIYSSEGEEKKRLTTVKEERDGQEYSVELEIPGNTVQVYRHKPFTQAEEKRFRLNALEKQLKGLEENREELRRDRDEFLMEQKRILKRKEEVLAELEGKIKALEKEIKALGL